jgi:hypothetical protein
MLASDAKQGIDIAQALLTAGLTLAGGCILFVYSQVVTEGLIKPYFAYRKVLADITQTLVFRNAIIISAPAGSKPEEHQEVSEQLRLLAAQLRSSVTSLRFPRLLRLLRLVPPQHDIREAAGRLTRISNRLIETKDKKHDEIFHDMADIGTLLHIDTPH